MSGRGRGRGSTLPAWMTHGDHPEGRDSRRDITHRDDRRAPDHNRDAPRFDRGRDFDRDLHAERPTGRGRGSMGRGLGYAPPLDRQEWDRSSNDRIRDVNFVRAEQDLDLPPAGRGRGRGRGISNKPAWMDSNGPTGPPLSGDVVEDKKDETMELLLAQARQVQQEQLHKKKVNVVKEEVKHVEQDNVKKEEEERTQHEQEALEKQRQMEEQRKAIEEERKRLELEREQEEQRQLLALVGDDMELDSNKRPIYDEEELFEFETEEEREERLARQRREERRKKLKVIENTSNGFTADEKVDEPRNPAGIIASEMKSTSDHQVKEETSAPMMTEENKADKDSDDDSFDIFAPDNPTPIPQAKNNGNAHKNAAMSRSNIAQECDDAEGYYKASIGEIITVPKQRGEDADDNDKYARFRVLGIIGKGVFSTVIKVVEESNDDTNNTPGREVAMKVIRNNEVMAKAAAKEMRILRMLCRPRDKKKKDESTDNNGEEEDPDEKERRESENHNIVRLLEVDPEFMAKDSSSYAIPPPEFRSHCIFLFEFLPYNLREVLSKFGKNVGITLTAVRSYARQLLCALGHLERHRIVHADLKPDNILVSANFSTVKLADFGSAFFETDHDNDPTPYLVSRFYRPPEVILGLEYDRMVDLWSTSVTLAELFTGSVLFPGSSNNDILMKFMDTLGPFSHKMVRRHAASYTKMGLVPHFEVGITGGTYRFCKHDVDRVTGQPVVRMTTVLSAKADSRLPQVLLRANGSASERVEVLKFADFLSRCLALDPARRLTVRDALKHEFFLKKKKKDSAKDNQ
ncbi:hypothetical protein ACHAXN_010357 [Cyclotella atomus]